jgi:UDP-2,3-diacylglucosamine hydrolase
VEEKIINTKNKIYFVSDSHLGVPDYKSSLEREKLLVKWLDEIKKDAAELYLLGDIFDFWFEYKTVVPKGYIRLLGKLAEIADSGIKIHYFTGNHDMWIFGYLPAELGIEIYRKPITREISGKRFMIGHGDGIGPKDGGYKFIKKVFANKFSQWLFARIHPNLGISIALFFSHKSRVARGDTDEIFRGAENERILVYTKEILQKEHFDYFIFGHRHLPFDLKIGGNSRYINLGDWVIHFTYAEFDGADVCVKSFCPENGKKIIREII